MLLYGENIVWMSFELRDYFENRNIDKLEEFISYIDISRNYNYLNQN